MGSLHSAVAREISKERKLYLEWMRIIAIFFVIFNHTGSDGFFLFSRYPGDPVRYWGYMFLSVFSKFSVPLFLAISGALMLDRPQEPLSKLWKGKILKIAVVLLLSSLYAYLENIGTFVSFRYGMQVFDIKEFITQIYSIPLKGHLWYLYTYLAYLILLPFLRTLVQNLENKYFYYLFAIAVVVNGVLPCAQYYIWKGNYALLDEFTIGWVAESVVIYPCIGYFLEHRVPLHKSGKKLALLWVVNILTIMISCYMTHCRAQIMGECHEAVSQQFHSSFAPVACVTMYTTVRYLCDRIQFAPWVRRAVISLGECTFGIYLFHMLNDDIPVLFGSNLLLGILPEGLPRVLVMCLHMQLSWWVITWILRKIPIIKKLL